MEQLIQTRSLAQIKNIWYRLDHERKKAHLTQFLAEKTSWLVFKVSMMPHDFASDTEDIINPDLLSLLYNDKEVYETLCDEPREDFSFKFVPGPPGCGKTTFMLNYIQGKVDS